MSSQSRRADVLCPELTPGISYPEHGVHPADRSRSQTFAPSSLPPASRPAHRQRSYRTVSSRPGGKFTFYLLINAALLFGLAQCLRTLISDVFHLSALADSQATVQKYYAQSRQENQLLQQKIQRYSSPSGIEELARNYLNMVGQDELPVRFQSL